MIRQDGMFVSVTYASCFLLKLMSPAFNDMVDRAATMALIERGARVLERVAADETHAPAICE